ncbi:cell division protein CrgA [Haloechinothrix sp. YIM 98757]|uniref:Cell division protein CrgA n=1 Tax=Haloechinothrix aidingensis TaxID=2752311 RepID=A0A838A7H4_9PSEU|nr:cell division protein CrgA [Haloechinothrix aidingensis]MBA0124082.1 cell division protein CrgA [Haloechinothrix aidingensis]
MPKSKVRKKTAYTPPADRRSSATAHAQGPTHPVYKAVMFGLMLLGLIWLVVNYLAGTEIPFMADLGNWNFAIGFALMITGLLMTMRWRE